MSKRYLYLIRHGQYVVTPELPHGKLTHLGQLQAEHTGKHLLDVPITKIYSSSMSRAVETAELIAENFHLPEGVQQSDSLRECVPSLPLRLEAQIRHYAAHAPDFDLEDIIVHRMQADEAYERYFRPPDNPYLPDSHELLVCHGNLIRYLVCRVLNTTLDAWANLYIIHCSISLIRVDDSGLTTLMYYNNAEHLPNKMRTEA